MKTIGIIGGGFVGSAMARMCMEHAEVRIFDVMPERKTHPIIEVVQSDLVFLCLPTPMTEPKQYRYDCDLSILKSGLNDVFQYYVKGTTVVIKSTVPVGTTALLAKEYDLPLVHSPEFLTARCALVDAQTPARNITGYVEGNPNSIDAAVLLRRWYQERFPGVPSFLASSNNSEAAKLACNTFFAVKVAFFNEFRQFAEAAGCDWEDVREMMLADGRIAHAHTTAPGPDGMWGFGGTCLPKDLQNVMQAAKGLGVETDLLSATWERNQRDRKKST